MALSLVVPIAGCATEPRFRGPMNVRNQHPAQLTVMHMPARGAAPNQSMDVQLDFTVSHTSLFLGGSGNFGSFQMDGELTRAGVAPTVGLGAGFELGFEVAGAHVNGGGLDDFTIAWHDFWGFPDQGRENAPRNKFLVEAQRQGEVAFSMRSHATGFTDTPFVLSWTPFPVDDSRPWGLGLRAGIELPTGDGGRGFGNDELDLAIGAFGEYRRDWLSLTGHAQHTFAGSPDSADLAGLEFEDVTSVGLGAELAVTDDLAGLVQVEFETSTLRGLGFPRAADDQWLIWTGFRAGLGEGVALDVALGEDLASFVAPDFTLFVGLRVDLSARIR